MSRRNEANTHYMTDRSLEMAEEAQQINRSRDSRSTEKTAPGCERQPEITDRIRCLFAKTDTVSVAIARLEEKLGPVLRPEGKDERIRGEASVLRETELGRTLDELVCRVRLIQDAVDSMIERAEL